MIKREFKLSTKTLKLMVSRQEGTFYSRKRDINPYGEGFHNSFKKRKQEDQSQGKLQNEPKSESMRSVNFDFELHLHTLPQKSIETKDYSRKSEDHRTCRKDPEMSLDLELNLSPSYSPTNKVDHSSNHNETVSSTTQLSKKNETGLNRSPSWLAFEVDVDQKEQEMVTTVCMKCHMLVMLCKSTPVCPNCKFMHPHDHSSSTKLFKPSNLLRLLC